MCPQRIAKWITRLMILSGRFENLHIQFDMQPILIAKIDSELKKLVAILLKLNEKSFFVLLFKFNY